MAERPHQPEIILQRSFPFIEVKHVPQRRREHSMMAVITALGAAALLYTGQAHPVIPAGLAFISGYALQAWLTFPDLYDDES